MTKEFIPYEQALALKELGFDETCFMSYNPNPNWWDNYCTNSEISSLNGGSNVVCSAPLYQQAFRWFREKYGYYADLFVDDDKTFGFMISSFVEEGVLEKPIIRKINSHEEAELECLNKLIEIVKL